LGVKERRETREKERREKKQGNKFGGRVSILKYSHVTKSQREREGKGQLLNTLKTPFRQERRYRAYSEREKE